MHAQGKAGFGRLWQYNAAEWPYGLIGCVGSFGLGFMMPGMAYCMSTVIAVLYNPDPAQVKAQVREGRLIWHPACPDAADMLEDTTWHVPCASQAGAI